MYQKFLKVLAAVLFVTAALSARAAMAEDKVKVKVFIGVMFEIGENSGDRAGEFQHWFGRYFSGTDAKSLTVPGVVKPVFCNADGVAGAVLGMGKVRSATSMQAILLDPRLDFSEAYFIISGVAGTPPTKGTIGAVSWATWLVDYDLGHRWSPEENTPGEPTYKQRKGYEDVRVMQLNPELVKWCLKLTSDVALNDSESAQTYRKRYPDETANKAPFIFTGTHMAGDCFFHGPGLSKEAQYIATLNGADDYVITEMEGVAVGHVIKKMLGDARIMSLRGAVNFDQGSPNETTLEHLDPAPGQTAGGFAETVDNITLVGSKVADYIIENWNDWKNGVPAIK